MKSFRLACAAFAATALVAACGGSDDTGTEAAAGSGGSTSGAGGAAGKSGSGGSGGVAGHLCFADPPAGAAKPDAMPSFSGGSCPTLVDGMNTIKSTGKDRQFMLLRPADTGSQKLPVAFLWHWLGGSAQDFLDRGEIAKAVETQHFIAVVPESIGATVFGHDVKWPFDISQPPARVNEELLFFDDMLACVTEQLSVNESCISSAGVSSGALWTDQLAGVRANYLASFLSLSGGTGGYIRAWGHPAHALPGLVLWGGGTDSCVGLLKFNEQSADLEAQMTKDGNFLVECIHNCGHSQPPVVAPEGQSTFAPLWDFFLDHPYWLKKGESPYLDTGLPATYPDWCAIGAGKATPRTGECLNPSQC